MRRAARVALQRFAHRRREQRTDARRQRPRRLLRLGRRVAVPLARPSDVGVVLERHVLRRARPVVGHREALLTQRPPQQQLGEEHHAGGVGAVGTHAAHGEDDHRRRVGGRDQLADEPVGGAIHVGERGTGDRRRRHVVQRVGGVDPVPQPLGGGVRLRHHDHPEVPVVEPLGEQPLRSAAAGLDAGDEVGTHLTGVDGRRPRRAVQPALAGIPTDLPLHLAQQLERCAGGPVEAGIVRTPRDHPAHTRCARQVDVGRVEHHRVGGDLAEERAEARALLPDRVGRGIELDRGLAPGGPRRQPRPELLPAQAGALVATRVEERERVGVPTGGEHGQLALRHELLGEGDLEAVESDRQRPPTVHGLLLGSGWRSRGAPCAAGPRAPARVHCGTVARCNPGREPARCRS